MAKRILPVFTRDHRTGLMKEFTIDEPKHFALAGKNGAPSHSRVLVADADETDRRLTIRQLAKAWPVERDILVECAADGAEALEKIRGNRYELVVLDWNMPHRNGADVLRAMREEGSRAPVVVVSSQRREGTARNLVSLVASFVKKDGLGPERFRKAIAASILLQEGVFGLVRTGIDTGLNA